MKRITLALRQGVVALLVFLMTCMAPTSVMAAADTASTDQHTDTTLNKTDTPTPAASDATTPSSDSTDSTGPTGADADTYHYDASSGLWVNDYFTYDPTTKATTPKVPYEYTYNTTTKLWDTDIWQFNADTDSYDQVAVSVATPPTGSVTHGGPTKDADSSSDAAATPAPTLAATQDSATAAPASPLQSPDQSVPSGDDSHHHDDGANSTSSGSSSTGATLDNTIGSTATSGEATASKNHRVGDTTTGDAQASTTVVNQLQSQSGLSDPSVATFTANIQGNVTGDMLIDPATFSKPLSAQSAQPSNMQINTSNGAAIDNTINLAAASGNATADSNNTAGNVISGDANALADIVNMINSVVAANQSFVGTINIYGDYTGNILMPADSLNALLGSNGGTTAADMTSGGTSNASIANNVNLAAASGDVSATGNKHVGNVSSGNALTNITILNLTGHQVVAANSLLVFVNVLGHWYGLIMDAPAGTTAAALGGGVTSDSALPANTALSTTDNYGITNTVTASATTGKATATNNRRVGDVASGNATASTDIANIINNNLSLSGWFGILFINVFGTWHGNFGVVKPAVVPPVTSGSALPAGMGSGPVGPVKAFEFLPTTTAAPHDNGSNHELQIVPFTTTVHTDQNDQNQNSGPSSPSGSDVMVQNTGAVLGTATTNQNAHATTTAAKQDISQGFSYWSIVLFALGAAGFGVIGVERVRSTIRRKDTISRI